MSGQAQTTIAAATHAAEEEASAAAQTTAAAAENTQLWAQLQQLRTQLHHEKSISQGLLDAYQQPEVAAATKRKQNTAAEAETAVPEWAGKCAQLGVKVQVTSKQHEGSTVYSRTDSRVTWYGFTRVGVRRDVHARQQAELTAYRQKQKIFRYRAPCERCFSKLQMQQKLELVSKAADKCADREAEATAEAAAAPTLQIREVEQGAAASRLRQAATPAAEKTDIFGLNAAATPADAAARAAVAAQAEADEVARTEAAEAEAAT